MTENELMDRITEVVKQLRDRHTRIGRIFNNVSHKDITKEEWKMIDENHIEINNLRLELENLEMEERGYSQF